MQIGTRRKQKETGPTLLELVLRLEGDIRRRIAPIRVTPPKPACSSFCVVVRRQSDGRCNRARREAAANEYGGEKPCAEALGHHASLG